MGLTSKPERQLESAQCSSEYSGNGRQSHVGTRSCQWMVVIMKYDMADNVRYNRDKRWRTQEKRTRHGTTWQKKSIQTTKKPPAETSVTSSAAFRGVT